MLDLRGLTLIDLPVCERSWTSASRLGWAIGDCCWCLVRRMSTVFSRMPTSQMSLRSAVCTRALTRSTRHPRGITRSASRARLTLDARRARPKIDDCVVARRVPERQVMQPSADASSSDHDLLEAVRKL